MILQGWMSLVNVAQEQHHDLASWGCQKLGNIPTVASLTFRRSVYGTHSWAQPGTHLGVAVWGFGEIGAYRFLLRDDVTVNACMEPLTPDSSPVFHAM